MISESVYVAGHTGLVGSAVRAALARSGYKNVLCKTRLELDLTNERSVKEFFSSHRPDVVILSAARVGGILANKTYPVDFFTENIKIQNNVISCAHTYKARKLIFLGSSCIYPRNSMQPIKEEYMLSGKLEKTNEAYAIAKLAGILLCRSYNEQYHTNFIAAMPTNLYGNNDNFIDANDSHVIPGLLSKISYAKNHNNGVTLWGTGAPLREFLHVDDLARALVLLIDEYNVTDPSSDDLLINIGSGEEISILELSSILAGIIEFEGRISWDLSKPDGTPRKILDSTRIRKLGWFPTISLIDGLRSTYSFYKEHII